MLNLAATNSITYCTWIFFFFSLEFHSPNLVVGGCVLYMSVYYTQIKILGGEKIQLLYCFLLCAIEERHQNKSFYQGDYYTWSLV